MTAARKWAATLVLSAAGIAGLLAHEGSVPEVYLDPVGIPTACVGHTATVSRADVGRPVSAEVCARLLAEDVAWAERAVREDVAVTLSQEQFDALVSFVFNVGPRAFEQSTMLRKLNVGDCWGAAAEFPRWNKAKGRVLPGLVKRRADERRAFETGCAV